MTLLLCPRTTSVNAWAVLVAPADRDQADPVRADRGRPEHPRWASGAGMAFAEIAAILLDVLQHDSAVPDPA